MAKERSTFDCLVDLIIEKIPLMPDYRSRISRNNRLGEFGIDSLDVVELAMEIEDKFGIHIPEGPESPVSLKSTVGEVVDFIEEELKKK